MHGCYLRSRPHRFPTFLPHLLAFVIYSPSSDLKLGVRVLLQMPLSLLQANISTPARSDLLWLMTLKLSPETSTTFQLFHSGMAGLNAGGGQADDLDDLSWEDVLKELDPAELARAASINKSCKKVSYDNKLWYKHFKTWSPEACVSSHVPLPLGL
jgi:hypothetical protein